MYEQHMAVFECYAWVSLLTKEMGDQLMQKLIHAGYHVGPLASSGAPYNTGKGTVLLSMKLKYDVSGKEEKTNSNVLNEIQGKLADMGASYNAVIVSNSGVECIWTSGSHVDPTVTKSAIDRLLAENDKED